MKRTLFVGTIAASLLMVAPLRAAKLTDPSWPCIQRKVENLSLGIMWPHPISEAEISDNLQPVTAELVVKLALRRVSIEETQTLIAEFVETNSDVDRDLLGKIFQQVFNRLASNRKSIIAGIKRYSLKQIELSKSIDKTRVEIATSLKEAEPDHDNIDKLEEKLDWDQRVFRDRTKSLTYVCETPVILEKRLFSIAQSLLASVSE